MATATSAAPGITIDVVVDADPADVWAELRHIERHQQWMSDAEAIRFRTDQREGVGTMFECDTKVGPFRLTDVMEITDWVDERRMGVRHVGIVTGVGTFTLTPVGAGTKVQWREELFFPWWMAGRLGASASRPVLRWVWKRNLARLASRIEPDDR